MTNGDDTTSKLFQTELRYAVHYWNVAEAASKLFNAGGGELQKGLHIFELEWDNIESAHRWASDNAEQHFYAAEMMHFTPTAPSGTLNYDAIHPLGLLG